MKKSKSKRRGLASEFHRATPKNLVKWAACGTVGLGLTHDVSAATLITFGGFTENNVQIAALPDYGDSVVADSADYTVSPGLTGVVGTPDILLDWFGGWDTYTDWNGRGNVAQFDFNAGGTATILFTPSALSAVRLVSFELDEWVGGGDGSVSWDVSDITGSRASGTFNMTNEGGRSLISPNVIGLSGDTLVLSLTRVTGAPSYFALDNLVFDQVPEPSTLSFVSAAALGAAAMRRRRSV